MKSSAHFFHLSRRKLFLKAYCAAITYTQIRHYFLFRFFRPDTQLLFRSQLRWISCEKCVQFHQFSAQVKKINNLQVARNFPPSAADSFFSRFDMQLFSFWLCWCIWKKIVKTPSDTEKFWELANSRRLFSYSVMFT